MKKAEKKKIETLPCIESQCENCLWYLGNRECAAFHGKIPDKVWNSLHDKVVEGQAEDLVFEENGPMI